MKMKRFYFLAAALMMILTPSLAQERVEMLAYGNMNDWISREVKESFIIGGKTVTLYEIGDPKDVVPVNTPYSSRTSPWAVSSVYARVKGITKGSVTVFPEKRDNGYCARLDTKVESVKVLGVININVLASGTIFLGHMIEPVTGTKDPLKNIVAGAPFNKKPNYLQFDYKVIAGGPNYKIDGLSKKGKATGTTSHAIAYVYLQHRWEDKEGNVHAKRIGTGWEIFDKTVTTWQNRHRIVIHYGDITREPYYISKMGLKNGSEAYYTRNSKGKLVPILEDGWGNSNDPVTHIYLQFSSSDGGPFVGNTESKFWIDNVAVVYEH